MTSKQTTRLGKAPEEGIKAPVVVASIANLPLTGLPIISGVQLVEGDRVLVKDQTDATQNGIYCAFVGNWDRANDWNKSNDVVNGQLVLDSNSGQLYRASFAGDFSINVTEVNFYIVQSFNSKDDVTLGAALLDDTYLVGDVVHIKSIDGDVNETTMIFDVVTSVTEDIPNGIYSGVSHSFVMRDRGDLVSSTLAEALARKDYKVGSVIEWSERTSGNGGGSKGDVVLASTVTPNPFDVVICTGVPTLVLKFRQNGTVTLSQLGSGSPNYIAEFDHALGKDTYTKVIVPDNATLGKHTFDSSFVKRIIGGEGITFDVAVAGAGTFPTTCGYVEIKGFTNFVLAAYPDTGGVIADGHQFVGLGAGAVIDTLIIKENSGTGGRVGISANFENDRTLNRKCQITNNWLKGQNGGLGGEGYGIQYANENDTGDCDMSHNTVEESGRHAFYIARNKGGGKITQIGNTAKNHRENSTTHGLTRAAFQTTRCKNVTGFGNAVEGYYDGAFYVEGEEEIVSGINAINVTYNRTTVRNPKNGAVAIRCGNQTAVNGTRNIGVHFDGVHFHSDDNNAPVYEWAFGEDCSIKNVVAHYENITTGSIRPFVLTGDTVANSKNLTLSNLSVKCEGCAGATLEVIRPVTFVCTNDIPFIVDRVTIDSDATTNKTWGPQSVITNTEIEIYGAEFTSVATSSPKVTEFPSGVETLKGSVVFDPPSIAHGAEVGVNVTVTGAVFGDFCIPSFSSSLQTLTLTATVEANNVVAVIFANNTGSAKDLPSGTVSVKVIKA